MSDRTRYSPEEKVEIIYKPPYVLNEGLEITYFVFTGDTER